MMNNQILIHEAEANVENHNASKMIKTNQNCGQCLLERLRKGNDFEIRQDTV